MFEKIIILGRGTVALNCAEILLKKGISPEIYCADEVLSITASRVRRLLGNRAAEELPVDEISSTERLAEEKKETLIISARNRYIIPKKILEKENIIAVNLHSAYLPFHPGRNAEAWAIFEEDMFSGITWHYMLPHVDKGAIICQKKIELTPTTTSLSLLRQQANSAVEAFTEMVDGLLAGNVNSKPQDDIPDVKMHYSWERPNDGKLDLQWNSDKISAFLRCYDYGILHILGFPIVEVDNAYYSWENYIISHIEAGKDSIFLEDNTIRMQKGTALFQLMNVKRIENWGR